MDECSSIGRKLSDIAGKHPVLQWDSARKRGELNCHLGLRRYSGRQRHPLINFFFSMKGHKCNLLFLKRGYFGTAEGVS